MTPDRTACVLISTRDRAGSLRETLSALSALPPSPGVRAEVLVVDNGSADDTPAVLAAAAAAAPGHLPLRWLSCPQPGKSRALNQGLATVDQDVVVLTDDDVRPHPTWLAAHVRAYDRPEVAAVQGPVHLKFASPPPAWYRPEAHGGFAALDHGSEPIFPFEHSLVGANMSVRRQALAGIGGYAEALGAGAAGNYEDDDVSARLRQAGHRQAYEPAAAVDHHVLMQRLTPAGFRRSCFRMGFSRQLAAACYGSAEWGRPGRDFARWTWRRAKFELKHALGIGGGRRGTLPQTEMFHTMAAGAAWAALLGPRRLRRRGGMA